MLKKMLVVLILISVLFANSIAFAYDEGEEELGEEEFEGVVQETLAEAPKIPNINSRHAVIYDRETRQNIIRQERERKMQNGINNQDNDGNSGTRKNRKSK